MIRTIRRETASLKMECVNLKVGFYKIFEITDSKNCIYHNEETLKTDINPVLQNGASVREMPVSPASCDKWKAPLD